MIVILYFSQILFHNFSVYIDSRSTNDNLCTSCSYNIKKDFSFIPTYIPHREKQWICQNVATNDIDVLRVTGLQNNKALQKGTSIRNYK